MAKKKNGAASKAGKLSKTHRARKGRGFGHPGGSMRSQRPQVVVARPSDQQAIDEGAEYMSSPSGPRMHVIEEGLDHDEGLTTHRQQQHHRDGHQSQLNHQAASQVGIPGAIQTQHDLEHSGTTVRVEGTEGHRGGGGPQVRLPPLLKNIIPGQRLPLISSAPEWKRLQRHAEYIKSETHLRDLLKDAERCDSMFASHDGAYLDYSRQRATQETLGLLFELSERCNLRGKIDAMVRGDPINFTEERSVLHTALRSPPEEAGTIIAHDGVDAIKEVHEVLESIREFTDAVRSGELRGYTGKRLRNIVSVGIGGSYLGPEFLHEVLKTEPDGINSSLGYSLRFLANVDPVDVERTCADLDPEETLIVIVSKTFTTAETMLNARTMRQWLWDFMGNDKEVVRKHVVACASVSSTALVRDFGIDTEKYFFRFWDWVGGRYSVCSAAGAVPISLLYGFDIFENFLEGAHSIDEHFINAPFEKNIPVLMGLLGVWNMSFLGYNTRATLPYAEALLKFPAHIQQLDMESNGKSVNKDGQVIDYPVGEVDFGEPGTNGQHSFYQLLHMGQTVAADFIGFIDSQHDLCIDQEQISSHDELMANFFAQPDALANGKTADEVRAEGITGDLVAHRTFDGNRPSMSLLLPKLTAYAAGQLLAIYEHRTAVQGFIWEINSFDQWGVELGKKLAIDIRKKLITARTDPNQVPVRAANPATSRILNYYVEQSREAALLDAFLFENEDVETPRQSNPTTEITRKTHTDFFPPEGTGDLGGGAGKLS